MREGIDLKGTVPRLNQCYLCKVWRLEKNLHHQASRMSHRQGKRNVRDETKG